MALCDLPVPPGWFDIGPVDAFAPGALKEISAFGEDLMLWRGEDGAFHLQQKICPHLGANIAADGRVIGNEVECPFHLWRFDGAGQLTAILSAPLAGTRARLRTYPVREWHGTLMAWYHPDLMPPFREPPAAGER